MTSLHIFHNGNKIQTLELDITREYLAGRSKECDIHLNDVVISRQHFKVFFLDNTWVVQALSKYSKLTHKGEEVDYFTLSEKDEFTAFDYRFEFNQDLSKEKSSSNDLAIVEDTLEITHEPSIKLESFEHSDEKTFVPEMASQDWSYGIPFLIIKTSDGKSKTLRLEGDFWTAGRDESCDIVLSDNKASREHFDIYKKQANFFILDKESSNGTYLNNKKISPHLESILRSGDTIQVGKTLMIFEVRDPLFEDKISKLPIEYNYQQPQEAYMHDSSENYQKVIRLPHTAQARKKQIILGAIAFLVIMALFVFTDKDESVNQASSTTTQPPTPTGFDQLNPTQQDLVEKSYTLAKTLYTQGKYELALSEIEKVHQLLPQYKDSKEIAQFSKNAIDTLFEQQEIARQEEEQKRNQQKVNDIISSCEKSYKASQNSSLLDSCLEPAIELDPENSKIKDLYLLAERNDAIKEERSERVAAHRAQILRRKNIFNQAQNLQKKGKILDAIVTYNRHIASTLPDPENLEAQSRKEVQTLKSKVNSEINTLKNKASDAYNRKDYKGAINSIVAAIKLNPQDSELKDQHNTYSKELYKIVKTLYADSVLEENLGNIESAKEKWKKIKDTDVDYGEYYKKATSKLKRYGL